MQATQRVFEVSQPSATADLNQARYARCIEASKRIRWDIDRDVFRGRDFDYGQKFLPDGLSLVHELDFLDRTEKRFLSQVQGRTYANIFGLVERFINAKVLQISREHVLGDQVVLEALIRFSDEEIKHQEMFRRIDRMCAEGMPEGYQQVAGADDVARVVLGRSTWSVLGLTCHIELFTQLHYKQSIHDDNGLSELYRDVFFYHWKEESQHAILDELEWRREDARITASERDKAVTDLIDLVAAVDGILIAQSKADTGYFLKCANRTFSAAEEKAIEAGILKAYRWQYIVSGVQDPRFTGILAELVTDTQMNRITTALAPLM
ncbi:MAG: hypothetical protein WBS20_03285 [Lysobacterales bacterium]